jgi:diguanylate cyclase (GGDEF)-like protein
MSSERWQSASVVSFARERLERRGDARGLVEEVIDFAEQTGQRIAALEARIAELEALCETDELTGAANLRGLRTFLSRSLARCARSGAQGAILCFDLNAFKPINDRWGHAAGDEVLREVVRRLSDELRPSDCVARTGGDEFVVVLDGVDHAYVQALALRFREAIVSTPFWVSAVQTVAVGVSVGVASYDGTTALDALMHRADVEMYEDKRRQYRSAA